MSHFKEREQKNCLNCGAEVQGRFCHVCGQENIEPKESVWHLISHFFQDITHFHGKFFSTLKYLLFKPGLLSREYLMGRRTSYLNPIRMYVFTSAIFFLFFFSIVGTGDLGKPSAQYLANQELARVNEALADLDKKIEVHEEDSLLRQTMVTVRQRFMGLQAAKMAQIADIKQRDSLRDIRRSQRRDSIRMALDSNGLASKRTITQQGPLSFSLDGPPGFGTLMAYDSVQAQLPPDKRDGWWSRLWTRKIIDVNAKASDRSGSFNRQLMDKFIHSLPQLFFLSLPIYAFFLLLLYKRYKQYYYVNHAIYSIHVFCATFIMTMVLILLVKYLSFDNDTLSSFWNLSFLTGFMLYQYKAMRSFYQQRRGKTILKLILLNFASFFVSLLLTTLFLIISLWRV